MRTPPPIDIARSKAKLRRQAGVSEAELLEILNAVRFTPAEQKQLTAATKQAVKIFGSAI